MAEATASLQIVMRARDEAAETLARLKGSTAQLEAQIAMLNREAALTGGHFKNIESTGLAAAAGIGQTGERARDAGGRFTTLATATGDAEQATTRLGKAAEQTHPHLSRVGTAAHESSGQLGELSKGVEAAGVGMFGMESVAKMAGAGVAVGLGLGAAGAVKLASDFQTATTELVTGAGESADALGMVRKGLLDMAGQVGVSATDLSKGLYMIESAGFHGAAGLDVLKASAEGAKVGGADMAVVSNAVTSALNAYHLPASEAVKVTNDLVATVASGKMHMEDLAGSLGKVLPAASTAHVSLAEVSGALATMTMQGTDAESAATYLRMSILQLENPSGKAQDTMKSLGLSAHQVGESLGHQGLAATFDLITQKLAVKFPEDAKLAVAEFAKVKKGTETADDAMAHLASNTSPEYIAALANMTGGVKGMQAALELTGGNLATFRANTAAVTAAVKEGGTQVKGWAEIQGDFGQQLDRAKAAVVSLAIGIGTTLLPYLTQAAGWFADSIPKALAATQDWFNRNRDTIMTFARDSLAVLKTLWDGLSQGVSTAVAAIVPLLMGLGRFLGEHKAALAALARVASTVFADAFKAAGEAIRFVTDHTALLVPILVLLGNHLLLITARWIAAKVEAVGSAIATAVSAEVNAARTTAAWLATVARTVGGFIATAVAATAQFAVVAAEAVVNAVKTGAAWLAQKIETIAGFVAQGVAAVAAFAVASGGAVASAAEAAAAWLGQKLEFLAGIAEQVGAAVVGFASMAAEAIATGATMAAAWLVGLGPIGWIIAGVAAIAAGFAFLYTHVEGFRNVVNTVFNFVRDHIQLVLTIVVGVLTGGLGALVILFVTHWTQIRDTVVGAFNAIVGFVTGGLGAIWSLVSTVFTNVWNFIAGAVSGFVGDIARGLGTIVGFFAGLPGRALSAVGGLIGGLASFAGHALGSLAGGLESAVGGVIGFFAGLPGRIIGAIGDLGTGLYRVAAGFVGRLVDGIRDNAGKIWDAVKHAIGNVIRAVPVVGGQVADHLGLAAGALVRATPGGVLVRIAEAGEDEWVIPAGKARGYEGMLASILSGAAGANRTAPPSLTASGAMASTRSLASTGARPGVMIIEQPPQVIETHITVDLDGREIARTVNKHLADDARLQMFQLGSGA